MTNSRSTHETALPDRRAPRHGPDFAALVSFATAIVLILCAYVAIVDVGRTAQHVIEAVALAGALIAAVAVNRVSTPTRRLPHPDKVRREQRHQAMLTGVLGAVLLLLAYTAAFDLDSWPEWTVFGVLVLTTVGAGIAIHSRQGSG
jgi:hypothetical protein